MLSFSSMHKLQLRFKLFTVGDFFNNFSILFLELIHRLLEPNNT